MTEQLRQMAEKEKTAAPVKIGPPKPPPAPSGPTLHLLPPPKTKTVLLPGAPGVSPIKQAASVVQIARELGQGHIQTGTALLNRMHAGSEVSQTEREAFRDQVKEWQLSVKAKKNELEAQGRAEAVSQLDELLNNSIGPKLTELLGYLID